MDAPPPPAEPPGPTWEWGFAVDGALGTGYAVLAANLVAFAVPSGLGVPVALLGGLAIAVGRYRPFLGYALGLLVWWTIVITPVLGYLALVPVGYALYLVAGRYRPRAGLGALVAAFACVVAASVTAVGGGFEADLQGTQVVGIGPFVWLPAAWLAAFTAGWSVGIQRRYAQALVRYHAGLAETERERTRRAGAEERVRIARELHDVVAHGMSVITVQAALGHLVIDREPARARSALAAIEATGRETLTEMRRLLGVLRDDGPLPLAPSPGLADLGRLVDDAARAGVRVDLDVAGQTGELPPGLQLAGYRIVQEALTNVVRHAGTDAARVTVGCDGDRLTLEIRDGGRGGAVRRLGHGLTGMQERVGLYGGWFEAGPLPGQGFRVLARLPVTGTIEEPS